jgi:hypothetical protein
MTTLYLARRQVSSPAATRELGIVILFCLLGLTISLAVLPWLDGATVGFVLNHVE